MVSSYIGAIDQGTTSTRFIVFDKTGTLTRGTPALSDAVVGPGVSEENLFARAAAVEMDSEHPLAKVIVAEAKRRLWRICSRVLPPSKWIPNTHWPKSSLPKRNDVGLLRLQPVGSKRCRKTRPTYQFLDHR